MTSSEQTAYSGMPRARIEAENQVSAWAPKIAQLYQAGHQFLPYEYDSEGWLFRGASTGFSQLIQSGASDFFDSEHPGAGLERELGIYLVSQDFSDAYSVARFWESSRDAFIAVFSSAHFNRELRAKRAAVLGFAEPGVVFKYPFLTHAPRLCEIDYLIVSNQDRNQFDWGCANSGSLLDPGGATGLNSLDLLNGLPQFISFEITLETPRKRPVIEKALKRQLESHGIVGAIARPSAIFPGAD